MLPRRGTTSWMLHAMHRASDLATVVTFGVPLVFSRSTTLTVAERVLDGAATVRVLQLQQWSGSKVGSGGFLWDASRRLVRYMEAHGDGAPRIAGDAGTAAVASRDLRGLKLLELGSGTGGMGLAAAVLGAEVTLTDQASFVYPGGARRERPTKTLLDLARANVQENAPVLLEKAVPLPTVAKLLWGDAADLAALPQARYDIIAGADVLLFTDAHEGLLQTLRRVSSASTVVLIEHTDRGGEQDEFPPDLLSFLKLVRSEGRWKPTVVRDYGRHITLRMVYA
tara:strand:+ start:51 stop:896 length:846 start_codon:yes stop_codon:yes gene_type:complete